MVKIKLSFTTINYQLHLLTFFEQIFEQLLSLKFRYKMSKNISRQKVSRSDHDRENRETFFYRETYPAYSI